jgi:Ca2+-binding RTX toxin-like protein
MKYNRSFRSIRKASSTIAFEGLDNRQLMSAATAVKAIDSGGPDGTMLTVGSTTYVVSSASSGNGWSQIYSTKGSSSSTKHLLDLRATGATISSIESMVSTTDGRVFFTAVGGTGGGRQLFQLNTSKGGYTQITKDVDAFYTQVIAIGNKLFMYDSQNTKIVTLDTQNKTKLVADTTITKFFQAKGQLFYANGDLGVFRSDGTEAGTYKINGDATVHTRTMFATNDYIYFEGTVGNLSSLYRSDGSSATPTMLAEDFSLLNASHAELGDYIYFSGGYYNTSPQPDDGLQLFRVRTSTGEVSIAANIVGSNGAGRADAIYALGTNIYYTAGDGDYLQSQGTTDRELYRYDTISGINKKITTGEMLAPVDDVSNGGGAGVLSTYYFTAAPTKDDFRFGTRKLYRTSPTDDSIVEVTGLPNLNYTKVQVQDFVVGAAGLFANVDLDDNTGDSDTFFIPTPYSYIDPVTKVLTVNATEAADVLNVTVDGDELVMNLNGLEERQNLADFTTIYVSLKGGDDKMTTNAAVTRSMSVVGDSGNDSIMTGSGNDSILGGAGKNYMYGMNGNDRLRGSSGYDYCEGGEGLDRIYGRGGSDNLHGNNGVDVIYGDDDENGTGNDTLYGESSNDKLYGFGGNDELYGGNQNDSLFAGKGDDKLYGQAGNDTLDGGAGKDLMLGLDGDDRFIANDGELDQILGGNGNDKADKDANESKYEEVEAILE